MLRPDRCWCPQANFRHPTAALGAGARAVVGRIGVGVENVQTCATTRTVAHRRRDGCERVEGAVILPVGVSMGAQHLVAAEREQL